MRQQIHRSALPSGQNEGALLERRLQLAFVAAPTALPCRPEPRATFDNASRKDQPARPWRSLGIPLRACAAAAAVAGGPVAEETRHRILGAILAFAAWVLEPLDNGVPLSTLCYSELMHEQAEALEAQALAQGLGTAEARSRAVRETNEAITAQRLYVAQIDDRTCASRPRLSLS